MKKETKKLIAAGIVMALSCGAWGSVSAENIQYKLDKVPGSSIFVNGKLTISKTATIFGVDGTNASVDGNDTHANGHIDQVDVGVYAANESAADRHSASYASKNIEILANRQEYTNLSGYTQIGAYARKNGDVIVGGDNTESVSISAVNNFAYLTGATKEKVKDESTDEWKPTGRYQLSYKPGAATGLYTNTMAGSGMATIAVNGKKIDIAAEALGESYGSRASGNSSILVGSDTTESVSIAAHGGTAKAIENNGTTSIKGEKITLKADSETTATGVYTSGDAITNIGTDKTTGIVLDVNGRGTQVFGLKTDKDAKATLQAKTVSIRANNNTSSSTKGISTEGISTAGETSILADNAELSVSGKNVSGIEFSSAKGNASIQAKNKLSIHVDGKDGSGAGIIGSWGKASLSADVLDISAKGKTARTVSAQTNATVELGKEASVVNLQAEGSEEAYAVDSVKPSTIKIGEDAGQIHIISKAGKKAHGVSLDNGTHLTMGGADTDISIEAHAAGETIGVFAMQETGSTTGGASVDIKGNSLSINAISDTNDSIGIHVQNSSTAAEDNKATVNVDVENTTIHAQTALSVMSQGVLNVNSNLVTNGKNAILTRGNSDVNINMNGKHTTQLNGDIVFDYDKASSGTVIDSNVNVNLNGEGSFWTGNTKAEWNNGNEGKPAANKMKVSHMTLQVENGAQWNPTSVKEVGDNSASVGSQAVALNSLKLNNGVVNLDSDKLDTNSLVKVENISGNGTITTNSLDNKLVINTKAANTKLKVEGSGEIGDKILAGKATLQELAGTAKEGDKIASDEVGTQNGIIAGRMSAKVRDGKIVDSTIKRAVQPHNQAVSSMANLSLMTWRQENNDMNKRLGEVRASEGNQGIWARMARGQSKYGAQGIKNQYNYYQLGYDSKISDDWILGGAFTYTDGDSSYTNGSGTNKHTGFAVYGSNLRDDGSFIDLIAKYAHMKNDFDVNGGVGSGDYSTNGLSFSAEYGKRFQQEGYWIEPQAELTYGRVSSADFTTKNGASVHQDSMDSLVGRLGFSLGKDIKQGNVYVRASYLYDFQGDTSVTMSKEGATTPFKTDLGGGWWEFGVGTNLNLGHDTHFYLDVETTAGGDVDTPWQWNAGVRYSF